MEFDISIFLICICSAFGLGWLASRFDLRQLKSLDKTNPKTYFKGLTLLLNEQQDKAIDAFIEAVRNDPEATELYFSLGNLFRRRGEHTNAVQVHQHLLNRADISKNDRQRATHALALDYLNAGILDSAEAMLKQLANTPYEEQAQLALLSIYERAQEWSNAIAVTQRLQQLGNAGVIDRRAHYECEQASHLVQQQQIEAAVQLLQTAAKEMPNSARVQLELAQLLLQEKQYAAAYQHFQQAYQLQPELLAVFVVELMQCAQQTEQQQALFEQLTLVYQQQPSIDVADVLHRYLKQEYSLEEGDAWLLNKLQLQPSLLLVERWLSAEKFTDQQYYNYVKASLETGVKYLKNYRCQVCNFEAQRYFWHCPGCQSWESYLPKRIGEQ